MSFDAFGAHILLLITIFLTTIFQSSCLHFELWAMKLIQHGRGHVIEFSF